MSLVAEIKELLLEAGVEAKDVDTSAKTLEAFKELIKELDKMSL